MAHIDLGSASYSVVSQLDGKPTAAIAIYQQPGSNSLDVSKGVKAKMQELSQNFPAGIQYNVTLDTTDVIHASIDEVMVTFLETTLLVVLVIFLFLQNWRAVVIPCITIPVSLIGTLAVMSLFGFSINTLTLFGLILAVAIVVDDAIVVVENSTRLLDTGRYTSRQAVTEAMGEITGPIVGVVLVLLASLICPWALLLLALFALIIFVDSSIQNKSLYIGILSVVAAFIQLTGYGTGFLSAWWKRCVRGKGAFSAFEKNFYE